MQSCFWITIFFFLLKLKIFLNCFCLLKVKLSWLLWFKVAIFQIRVIFLNTRNLVAQYSHFFSVHLTYIHTFFFSYKRCSAFVHLGVAKPHRWQHLSLDWNFFLPSWLSEVFCSVIWTDGKPSSDQFHVTAHVPHK